jgi:hypothetical protein
MEQIFNLINMLMNISVNKTRESSAQLLITVRKLILLGLVALGAMALFCVGVAIIVADLARQIENPMIIGIVLSLFSVIVLIICFQKKAWVKTKPTPTEPLAHVPSPIEAALALLITDIVSERQLKRKSDTL